MASIVTQEVTEQTVQADGRLSVVERFADSLGGVFFMTYLSREADLTARLQQHADEMLAGLVVGEIARNVAEVEANGSLANIVIAYSTNAQNLAALREAYRNATRLEAVMIGDFLASLTDANLRNIFDITQAQVTALRANRLTPAANVAASIRAASGE